MTDLKQFPRVEAGVYFCIRLSTGAYVTKSRTLTDRISSCAWFWEESRANAVALRIIELVGPEVTAMVIRREVDASGRVLRLKKGADEGVVPPVSGQGRQAPPARSGTHSAAVVSGDYFRASRGS
jgi:hypothetical protein